VGPAFLQLLVLFDDRFDGLVDGGLEAQALEGVDALSYINVDME